MDLRLTRRSFAAGMAALACAAGLSVAAAPAARADQQTEPASDPKASGTADAPAFPITIEHAFGETVVEQEPERVVCLAWSNMEAPLALGIAPVGYSAPNYGLVDENGTWPWAPRPTRPWAPRPPCSSTTPTASTSRPSTTASPTSSWPPTPA